MQRPRANIRRAFTLIELILVLAIIATIAAIAIPSVSNFERGQRVGDTADQIVALARWARTQSIARGICYRLNVDQAQGRYWLSMQDGASYENALQDTQGGTLGLSSGSASPTQFNGVGEEMGRDFVTPRGVDLSCNFAPQPDGQYVEFRPTGRCDPGAIRISDASGKVIEIGCLSATENYHVLSDDEKQLELSLQQPPPGGPAR